MNGGPATRRRCGAMAVHRRLLTESATYRAARAAIETQTLASLAAGETGAPAEVVRIPVVVHVVYATPEQNIGDEQIHSQIAVLNRDFRATNPDVDAVPDAYRGLVADCRVEFTLAGITRHATTVTSFDAGDGIKSRATGGTDPWPTDRFLNIWVGELSGGLLGYAQFPGGPAETDGVVVTSTGFGTTGTAAAPFDGGRTTTHEVGHYLNLFHIWGDDGTGCGGSDEVDDTPNQAGPNYGRPAFPSVTCRNGPHGDLFMNYMDYVDDAAMMMFTHGQAARMGACLSGVRAALRSAAPPPAPVRAGRPVLASWGPGRLDVFVIGTDAALHHRWYDGTAWHPSAWANLGGPCAGEPQVVSWAPGRLDVFVDAPDGALQHKWFDGTAWGPSADGFDNLGSTLAAPGSVPTPGVDPAPGLASGPAPGLTPGLAPPSGPAPALPGEPAVLTAVPGQPAVLTPAPEPTEDA